MQMVLEVFLDTFQVFQLLILGFELVNDLRNVDVITNINLLDLFLKFAQPLGLILFVLEQPHSLLLA